MFLPQNEPQNLDDHSDMAKVVGANSIPPEQQIANFPIEQSNIHKTNKQSKGASEENMAHKSHHTALNSRSNCYNVF